MTKRDTKEDFILKAKLIYGEDRYDYSLVIYVNNHTKVKIICKKHGVYEQRPNNHLNGQGCFKCGVEIRSKKCEVFIMEAKKIHGDEYDYSLVNYINSNNKVIIICKIHGNFEQKPAAHLSGKGCINCYGTPKKDTEKAIADFKIIHGDTYDYSLVDYISCIIKVIIICKKHGLFKQTPSLHLLGYGCRKCGKNALKTLDKAIEDFKKIHGDKYDYSLVDYINNKVKVKIICAKHGIFKQRPDSHINGKGCQMCGNSVSKISQLWLNSFNNPNIIREEPIIANGRRYIVDGIDYTTNTVYEFDGEMWHGNPRFYEPNDINPVNHVTYGELYQYTLQKKADLESAGYTVVSIWESDWRKQMKTKKIIKD